MFSLIPLQYRIAAIVLLLLGTHTAVFVWRGRLDTNAQAAAQLRSEQQAQADYQRRTDAATVAAIDNANAAARQAVVYRDLNREVVRYVQTNPASVACSGPDADWLRIDNTAAQPRSTARRTTE